MSKRFGRNRRRRAREELAAAQELIDNLSEHRKKEIFAFREEVRNIEDAFREIAKLVGEESIASGIIPKVDLDLDLSPLQRLNSFRMAPMSEMQCAPLDRRTAFKEIRAEVLRLLSVKVIQESFKRQMVVRVQLNEWESALAISDSVLERVNSNYLEELVTREIAPQLAQHLIQQIKR